MKLIALLSWYDEQSAWLAELVASMGRVGIDHVVAVDGAYALYPRAERCSPSEQAQTVLTTALGAGMGVTVHAPPTPWFGNEVEKRSWMFSAGRLVAEPGEDWFWVCDADEVIEGGFDRAALARTRLDVADVLLVEDGSVCPIRKLFRAHPGGIRVEGHHARYVDGAGRVLWDSRRRDIEAESESLWDVRARHRPRERTSARTERRNAYYNRRGDRQIEVV